MEAVVAQTLGGQFIERRHVARTAEGAGLSETDIVKQDDHDVRRSRGALTSKRGGALALRASSSVIVGGCGSGTGNTVRSICCAVNDNGSKLDIATSKWITGELSFTISDFIVIGVSFQMPIGFQIKPELTEQTEALVLLSIFCSPFARVEDSVHFA